MMPGLNQHNTK